MKKIFILFVLLFSVAVPVLATEMKLLAKYPKTGFYYYYSPDFKFKDFNKPVEINTPSGEYTMFVYTKQVNPASFTQRHNYKIEDDFGYMFDMISVGIENQPLYYIRRQPNYIDDKPNDFKLEICQLKSDNTQIKYILDPVTNTLVKQLEFNNGELGIGSLCNPSYIPGQDI